MGRQRSPGLHGQCSQKLLRSPRLGPPPPSRARCPFTFADVRPGKSSGCILRLTWKYRSSSTQSAPVELSEKSSVGTVGHVQHAEGVIPSISRKISQVVPSLAALILPFKGKSEFYVRNTYKTSFPAQSRWARATRFPTPTLLRSKQSPTFLHRVFNDVLAPRRPSRLWTVLLSGSRTPGLSYRSLHGRGRVLTPSPGPLGGPAALQAPG